MSAFCRRGSTLRSLCWCCAAKASASFLQGRIFTCCGRLIRLSSTTFARMPTRPCCALSKSPNPSLPPPQARRRGGGGVKLALAGGLRIAERDGGRIGLPEVALGVLPGTGGTQRLPRLVGKARAIELMATGRVFAFEEALEIGLIEHIFEPEDFFE